MEKTRKNKYIGKVSAVHKEIKEDLAEPTEELHERINYEEELDRKLQLTVSIEVNMRRVRRDLDKRSKLKWGSFVISILVVILLFDSYIIPWLGFILFSTHDSEELRDAFVKHIDFKDLTIHDTLN